MIKGKLSARAVALQDLIGDMEVLDKKEISLGLLQLDINEQTKRTLEEEIEQKHKVMIDANNKGETIHTYQEAYNKPEDKEKEKEEQEEQDKSIDDGADDLII